MVLYLYRLTGSNCWLGWESSRNIGRFGHSNLRGSEISFWSNKARVGIYTFTSVIYLCLHLAVGGIVERSCPCSNGRIIFGKFIMYPKYLCFILHTTFLLSETVSRCVSVCSLGVAIFFSSSVMWVLLFF